MIYGISALILWIATVIGYVIWNLYNKNRKMEQMVVAQQLFIDNIKECMKEINVAANQIDSKIWVQSDPEFLGLMENVKVMQNRINQFIEE
jgi:hypothetical protein